MRPRRRAPTGRRPSARSPGTRCVCGLFFFGEERIGLCGLGVQSRTCGGTALWRDPPGSEEACALSHREQHPPNFPRHAPLGAFAPGPAPASRLLAHPPRPLGKDGYASSCLGRGWVVRAGARTRPLAPPLGPAWPTREREKNGAAGRGGSFGARPGWRGGRRLGRPGFPPLTGRGAAGQPADGGGFWTMARPRPGRGLFGEARPPPLSLSSVVGGPRLALSSLAAPRSRTLPPSIPHTGRGDLRRGVAQEGGHQEGGPPGGEWRGGERDGGSTTKKTQRLATPAAREENNLTLSNALLSLLPRPSATTTRTPTSAACTRTEPQCLHYLLKQPPSLKANAISLSTPSPKRG